MSHNRWVNYILGLSFLTLLFGLNFARAVEWSDYEIKYKQQVSKGKLGYIEVAENRQVNNSRKIRLGFVKLASYSENPKAPIVYLAGGPGGSATGAAQSRRYFLFEQLRQVADVIVFDQRGTGLSRNDLKNCHFPTSVPLEQALTRSSLLEESKLSAKFCAKQWREQGIDLNGYNTLESVADLEALRQALRVDKISLWGISYGTHLALAMAKYYPNSIERLVLASSEGLDHTVKQPQYSDLHLAYVAKQIASQPKVAQRYPDLLGLMREVHHQYQQKPVQVEFFDKRSGKTVVVGISDVEIQLLTAFAMTKDAKDIERLPAMYALLKIGQIERFAPHFAYLRQRMWQLNPMSIAMDAASGISQSRWQQVQQQAKTSILWRAHNLPFPDINHVLKIKDLGDEYRTPFKSDIPTLFLAGTLDGRTFYQAQREVAQDFSQASFITVEGAGHNLLTASDKIAEFILLFYQGNNIPQQTITLPSLKFL